MTRTWVLLRGLIRESRHWEAFPALLAQQFPSDQVVMIDLPGNGYAYQKRSPTHVEMMVTDVRRQLSDQGLRPPFHVLALSLGAMTTISWRTQYPDEVATAILLNTSVSRFSPFWQRLKPANYRQILFKALLAKGPLQKEETILAITTNLIGQSARDEIAHRWAEYASTHPVSTRNALRQLWAAARFKAPGRLDAADRVLLLNGAGDRMVDPACSDAMAHEWGLKLLRHPSAGHDLTLDAGQWVVDSVRDWLPS